MTAAFWDVASRSMTEIYRRLGVTNSLNLQGKYNLVQIPVTYFNVPHGTGDTSYCPCQYSVIP